MELEKEKALQKQFETIRGQYGVDEQQDAPPGMFQDALFAEPVADPPNECKFSFDNPWSVQLFITLCKSQGLQPFRRPRMRQTTVCIKAGPLFVEHRLWPAFERLNHVLDTYLQKTATHIIHTCMETQHTDVSNSD